MDQAPRALPPPPQLPADLTELITFALVLVLIAMMTTAAPQGPARLAQGPILVIIKRILPMLQAVTALGSKCN